MSAFAFAHLSYSNDAYEFLWATNNVGSGSVSAHAVAVNQDGSVWVTGAFSGTNIFGNTILTNSASDVGDFYLAKFGSDGNPLWATQGFQSTDWAWGFAIDTDSTGNVFVGGQFKNTFKLGTNTLVGTAGSNAFLAKYNSEGNLLWVQQLGSNGKWLGKLKVDRFDNVYFTTGNSGTESFGGVSLTSNGGNDACIIKLDNDGNVLWAKSDGGTGGDFARGVAVDSQGNVYVTGNCSGTTTWGTTNVIGYADWDIFLAKYDASGTFEWVRVSGGYGQDEGTRLAVDSEDNIYMTGYFSSTGTFDTVSFVSAGNRDGFLARYDGSGNLEWIHQFGGTGSDGGWGIDVNPEDIVLLTGYIVGSAQIGTTNFPGNGNKDVIITAFSSLGEMQWGYCIGGSNADSGASIVHSGVASLLAVGTLESPATFGSIPLNPESNRRMFITKLVDIERIKTTLDLDFSNGRAGLSISGAEGSNVEIEYTDNLSASNSWQVMTNFVLQLDSQVVMDLLTGSSNRFYRAKSY